MRTRPIDERLGEIPLFHKLTKKQLKELAKLVTGLDIEAGRVLIKEGETGREFFVVVSGEAEVVRDGQVVATRGPGTFFGEFSLLLDLPRTASVVARTDMTVDIIERRDFRALLEASPALYKPLLESVALQLAGTADLA